MLGLSRRHKMVNIDWNPPPEGWVKINIDGAFKRSQEKAGCGGLCCGSRGE